MTAPSPCSPEPRDVWCAIPVYNNAATIVEVTRRCRNQIANVIVVDDGSSDADLRQLLGDCGAVILRHPHNLGKGAALLTALHYANQHQGRWLIAVDGDGQHFPEDIPRFIAALASDTILVGHRQEVSGVMPRSSRFGREFSDFWIHVETGVAVFDTQSGFRAYPVGPLLNLHFSSRHYNFEIEAITRSIWAGLQVRQTPIRVWYPPSAERVSSFRPFQDNLRISLMHARLVGRELLPIPHRRLAAATLRTIAYEPKLSSDPLAPALAEATTGGFLKALVTEHATPLGLAAAAGLGLLLGSLPMPVIPAFVAIYMAVRLHLNKLVTLAMLALCIPPLLPTVYIWVGARLLHGGAGQAAQAHRWLEWLVGSLLVPPPLAAALTVATYRIARRFTPAMEPAPEARSPLTIDLDSCVRERS